MDIQMIMNKNFKVKKSNILLPSRFIFVLNHRLTYGKN